MFITFDKVNILLANLNYYANIKNKVNYNFDFFYKNMSNKNVIINGLTNSISSICQRKSIDINSNKKIKEVQLIYYNSKKKYKYFGPWKKGEAINKEILKYDNDKNLIEFSFYKKGKRQVKVINNYNVNSKLSRQTFFNSNNYIELKAFFEYNQNSELIEEVYFTGEDVIVGKYKYISSEKRHTKASVFNSSNDIIAQLEFIFSEDNRLLEVNGLSPTCSRSIEFWSLWVGE